MSTVLSQLGTALKDAFLMAWEVWWALVLGFLISAIVQSWVPRARIERSLSDTGARPIALATGLGAASSSCSYAAIAIAKTLFQKGASAASAMAFQFASTNLVWELGFVLWVLIGWQFTLAEYLGGILMTLLMVVLLRAFVPRQVEGHARRHAQQADTGHQHHMAGSDLPLRERLTSVSAWSDVAHNFRGDWQMLWKEIIAGFVLAGLIGLLGNDVFNTLFLTGAPSAVTAVENVIVGPIIAILSFVCSVGNVPLAAVLWSGGISFGGVIAFIFADLIILPIISAYRKYYGWSFALRITALMFVTMATAALLIDALFSAAGLVPTTRPTRDQVFGEIAIDYKLVLNLLGFAVFSGLFALTIRRGATDPVCHMTVDRTKALTLDYAGRTYYFCSEGCRESFQADPDRYTGAGRATTRGIRASDQRKTDPNAGLASHSIAAADDDTPMTPEIQGPPSDRTLPRMIVVEVLVTDNCPHEDDAINLVTMAAQGTGVTPRLTLIEIHDLEQAEQQQFLGSPTIRINGSDIAPPTTDHAASLACRLYHTTHGLSGVPELDLVRTALENARADEQP
jgi:uncharacterized protein